MICPSCGVSNLPGADACAGCELALSALDLPSPANPVEGSLLTDRVAVLLPKRPVTVPESATLGDAMTAMMSGSVGAVLVTSAAGRLTGILTERDFLTKVAGSDTFAHRPVSDFMTRGPETVSPDDPLAFALRKMDVGGYRHLPVVHADRPVGVISVRDLLRHVLSLCQPKPA